MIKAIIFDFGRVISAAKPKELFHGYEDELGLEHDTINQIMFESDQWQQTLVGRMTMSQFWQAIGPSLKLFSAAEVTLFQNRYYADEKINTEILPLLKRLHSSYQLAILSNHPPGLRAWLEDWDIDGLFEVIFCSGDEGMAKPDPEPFRLTLERLGVEAAEAVFIDDTPGHVEAALALDLHGLLFSDCATLISDLALLTGRRFALGRMTEGKRP
jgi:epoxide hydrolase-like predicted phosphatase